MSEDDNKIVTMKVRVTPEFREKIIASAKENNRSMNAEIVHRLEESFFIQKQSDDKFLLFGNDAEQIKSDLKKLQVAMEQLLNTEKREK
ncbi:arc-like DNA binding domain protein [Acinetobacter sp. 1295259]|uniref:Arc family DNA-binding protein n=1 Tax=Acinetobacter calcoaceticus/baumannii complex TaxID=909768 RepID=UPI00044DF027|nr:MULTISPECIES: Arc family DNA-binding protein [Acinetobacter calcoaceticus/baumannii complex]EXA96562.1 arc-like DNA binding domain protein [Acinetobacter sp. 1295259]RSO72042.1 Arc family DNA-binding protein [Acinetobacter pittii]